MSLNRLNKVLVITVTDHWTVRTPPRINLFREPFALLNIIWTKFHCVINIDFSQLNMHGKSAVTVVCQTMVIAVLLSATMKTGTFIIQGLTAWSHFHQCWTNVHSCEQSGRKLESREIDILPYMSDKGTDITMPDWVTGRRYGNHLLYLNALTRTESWDYADRSDICSILLLLVLCFKSFHKYAIFKLLHTKST